MMDLSSFCLLIVDDEEMLRQVVVTHLLGFGCRILQARNGREAFDLVKTEKVDLILSDIRMPGGDGIELLERVRARGAQPPVIIMTGFSDYTMEELMAKGAQDVLSKPFVWPTLLESVEKSLKKAA